MESGLSRKLIQFGKLNKITLLGIGPMSQNCIDATIELANAYEKPLMLIASRRQIDSADFGGGYVNNWTTEDFCRYVRSKDNKGYVFLARDHGGPWQNDQEVMQKMALAEAMESAKTSYRADISAGMNILHLDPNRNLLDSLPTTIPEFIERTKELLLFCHAEAAMQAKSIAIEIGTDEGTIGSANAEETEQILLSILDFCKQEHLPKPVFMVLQTGTKVMEMRNVGKLDKMIKEFNHFVSHDELKKVIALCNQHDLLVKEHNADYLFDHTLLWHPEAGINSANVAPEFGVIETKAFLSLLVKQGLSTLHDKFVELAFNSAKWKKWMLADTKASDYDRAVIAGHYIFSNPEFSEIKKEAQRALQSINIMIDDYLKNSVKQGILRYLRHFRLINGVME